MTSLPAEWLIIELASNPEAAMELLRAVAADLRRQGRLPKEGSPLSRVRTYVDQHQRMGKALPSPTKAGKELGIGRDTVRRCYARLGIKGQRGRPPKAK